MSDVSPQITDALMRAAVDIGHGGPFSEYRINSEQGVYAVTLRISGTPRAPGASQSQLTEVLSKDARQVEEFLRRLSAEFDVYGLNDLKSPYPFLHPTFYTFAFRDSAGGGHGFEYQIECANHLDERYKRLVEEFERFFETRRAFAKFYESRQQKGRQ